MKQPIENADFGKTARDYLTHRPGFPKSLFVKLQDWGIGVGQQTIIDLGTGTGTIAQNLSTSINQIFGIDPSKEMLAAARELSVNTNIQYLVGRAEATGLNDNIADVVTAGQCWHWFDHRLAAAEILRILKPTGVLVVPYFDWIPLSGNIVRRTEALIEQYNPAWKGGNQFGIHPQLFRQLGDNGFTNFKSFTYDEQIEFSHRAWRGRIRASAGVGASLSVTDVDQFDQALKAMLKAEFPTDPLNIPHRVFALYAERSQ